MRKRLGRGGPRKEEKAPMTRTFDDPVRCAEAILDQVGREVAIAVPIGIGKPNRVINALYELAAADRGVHLKIFTGLTLVRPTFRTDLERRFAGPLLDRLFPTWPELIYAEALRDGRLPPNIEVHEFFLQPGAWLANDLVQRNYASLNYSHVAAHLQQIGTNVLAQLVAPCPDASAATFSLSSNTDVTLDMADYVAARRRAGQPIATIAEVNANLPYMRGDAEVGREHFDSVLETPPPHFDLFAPPKEPVTLADYAMALHAATLVKDDGTLQIGIGSFADALAHALVLRHTRNREFRELIAKLETPLLPGSELHPFTKGLYGCSEMLVDGFLALRRAGILTRKVAATRQAVSEADRSFYQQAILHAGFFVGSKAFYRELREMPRSELDEIVMTAISFTNTLHGDTAAKIEQRRNARFINTAMTATLLGSVSSDQLESGRVVSGIGGQQDFVVMAHELPDARSIIALRSTRSQSGGRRISNIFWSYGNTSIPRQLRDIIITEYGIADIRGKSDGEVVAAMLGIADSSFQGELRQKAAKAGKLAPGFSLPRGAVNRPERIREALQPARDSGLLPPFPLGTEMTETEQNLARALSQLKYASLLSILGGLARNLGASARSASEKQALARLSLDAPRSVKERALRAIVLAALRG
jgi:acyl-CoA hydrolase